MNAITVAAAALFLFLGAALASIGKALVTDVVAQPTALGTVTIHTGENLWLLESIGRNQTKIWACTPGAGAGPVCSATDLRFETRP